MLGSDEKNKDIAVLVRGQLCTALSKVLLHGFKAYKLIGRYHIWDFVQESTNATEKRLGGGAPSEAERTLLAAVLQVNSHDGMANNPNIKFRSFVCCGLNARQLDEWIAVLTVDKETMAKFYEPWAFVQEKGDLSQLRAQRWRPCRSTSTASRSTMRSVTGTCIESVHWDLA